MKKAILVDLMLSTVTPSFRRPEDQRHLSFDAPAYNQSEFELSVNNSTGVALEAEKTLIPSTFVYVYVPYPVELTVNGMVLSSAFTGLFLLSAGLNSLRLRNLSLTQTVVCSTFTT